MSKYLNFNKHIPKINNHIVLDEKSKKILSDMQQILATKYKKNQNITEIMSETKVTIIEGIIKSELFNHIPETIREIIEKSAKSVHSKTKKLEWTTTINNSPVKINLHINYSNRYMGSNGLKYVTTASLMKYYILVRTVIDFLAHYTQHNAREKIDIYLYLTTHIKISPNDNKIADWINVNTGLTTFCKNETEINIFRAEECFKVFIHECIHNLCLDFGSNGFPLEQLKQTFMVNSEYLLFETYTETWAEIIQILFFNIHNGHNGHNIEIKINDEFTFSAIQCDKIMKICTQNPNASYLDVFNQNKMVLNQYNENSNCFAYYVLKTITLYNINEFLLWCNENNNKILCFNKIDSKKTIRNFIEFIIADTHYKNEAMMKAINHVMLKHKIHKDSFMAKTLRMSIYELVP